MLCQFGIGRQQPGRAIDRAIRLRAHGAYDFPLAVRPAVFRALGIKRPDPAGAVGLVVDLVFLDPIDDFAGAPGTQPGTDDAGDNRAGAGLDTQQCAGLGAQRCAGPTTDTARTQIQHRGFRTCAIVTRVQVGNLRPFRGGFNDGRSGAADDGTSHHVWTHADGVVDGACFSDVGRSAFNNLERRAFIENGCRCCRADLVVVGKGVRKFGVPAALRAPTIAQVLGGPRVLQPNVAFGFQRCAR